MRTLFLILTFLVAFPAYAEEGFALYATQTNDDSYVVEVYTTATQVPINAVEGTLSFGSSASILNVSSGGSVVGYWVEQPTVTDTSVHFSGIFPGGFTHVLSGAQQGNGFLFSVEVKDTDRATLRDSAVFLNDGEGTRISTPSLQLSLLDAPKVENTKEDTTPPEWVLVERVPADEIEQGKEMLVISAYDAGSGISHFEVRESGGEWTRTQTPYVVTNDSLFNRIQVRAYDFAGNMTEVSVASPFEKTIVAFAPYVLGVIVLIILLVYLGKRFKRSIW